jgi:predicted protein tyrosine phosphatase
MKLSKIIILLLTFNWALADEDNMQKSNKVEETALKMNLFTEKLIAGDCYCVIMIPCRLSVIEDNEKIGGSAKDGFILGEKDTKEFIGKIAKNVKYPTEIEQGDNYEIIFLMRKTPTSETFKIYGRIMENDRIIIVLNPSDNTDYYELDRESVQWIKSKLVLFKADKD